MEEGIVLQAQCKEFSDDSFEEQIGSFELYLKKIIFGILKTSEDTEDAYQEILQKIYHSMSARRGDNFKGWIARIAVNHSIDYKKRWLKENATVALEDVEQVQMDPMDALAGSVCSPDEILQQKESLDEIRTIIADLPEIYQEVIRRYYGSDESMKEIAADMQLNLRTVETRIFRAKKMIREKWRNHAY